MTKPPTPRQLQILAAVRELTGELGRKPSATEIAARVGVTRHGILVQLRALETKGLLSDTRKLVSLGKWEVTGEGEKALGE